MQIPELKNDKLLERIIDRGMTLQAKLKEPPNPQSPHGSGSPQSLWTDFKDDIVKIAKKHCAKTWGKLAKKIKAIKKDLKSLTRNPELDTNNTIRVDEAYLANELATLKQIQAKDKKDETRAVVANHGEVLGGVWSGMNKDRKPRDMIPCLKVPNMNEGANDTFERDSRRMAKLTRDYHEDLQAQHIIIPDDSPDLERKTASILSEIPEHQRLLEQEVNNTEWLISYPQVWKALSLSKNGTATGLDGCPYELWKELDKKHSEAAALGRRGFNIVAALTCLFTDIQMFRVKENLNFASGWMCPLYKKKDPMEISNYRPITLLNTDYKLLTKTLASNSSSRSTNLSTPTRWGSSQNVQYSTT